MAGVIDQIDKANMTIDELADYLRDVEGMPVTRRQMRNAVHNGEIEPTNLSNANYFSIRDGLDWLASRKGIRRGDKKRRAEGAA